jgi:hypothetical protein
MRNNNFNRQNTRNNSRDNNRNNGNIRWFNAHTEGCGYINGLRHVTPKQGQSFDPFWASTFCMLEGDPSNPTQKYINVTIVNKHVLDILLEFEQDIASGQVTVFAGVKLSNIEATPFVYDENSKTPGELGINWSARVINLFYLKVGDEVINVKGQPTTDMGVEDDQSRGNQQYHQDNQGYQGRNTGDQSSNRQAYPGNKGNGSRYQGNQQQGRHSGKSQRPYQGSAPR